MMLMKILMMMIVMMKIMMMIMKMMLILLLMIMMIFLVFPPGKSVRGPAAALLPGADCPAGEQVLFRGDKAGTQQD